MAGKLVVGEIEDGAGVSQGTNPTGTVIMFYGSVPPTGYLECNGQSATGFDDLIAIVGANVPDLRGEFIRGWDNGRGVDTGRTLGSTQADEFKSHNHTTTSFSRVNVNPSGVANPLFLRIGIDTTSIGFEGGDETRPRNVSLMYCIKT